MRPLRALAYLTYFLSYENVTLSLMRARSGYADKAVRDTDFARALPLRFLAIPRRMRIRYSVIPNSDPFRIFYKRGKSVACRIGCRILTI